MERIVLYSILYYSIYLYIYKHSGSLKMGRYRDNCGHTTPNLHNSDTFACLGIPDSPFRYQFVTLTINLAT
jgi:hypothetical protein